MPYLPRATLFFNGENYIYFFQKEKKKEKKRKCVKL